MFPLDVSSSNESEKIRINDVGMNGQHAVCIAGIDLDPHRPGLSPKPCLQRRGRSLEDRGLFQLTAGSTGLLENIVSE